jgi:hypothetical protein
MGDADREGQHRQLRRHRLEGRCGQGGAVPVGEGGVAPVGEEGATPTGTRSLTLDRSAVRIFFVLLLLGHEGGK